MSNPVLPHVPALDELERLEKAATSGPWLAELDRFDDEHGVEATVTDPKIDMLVKLPIGGDDWKAGYESQEWRDAQLIAAARNALPSLLKIARAVAEKGIQWNGEYVQPFCAMCGAEGDSFASKTDSVKHADGCELVIAQRLAGGAR